MPSEAAILQQSAHASANIPLATTGADMHASFDAFKRLAPSGGFPSSSDGFMDPGEAYKYGYSALQNFKGTYLKGKHVPDDLLKYVAGAGGGAGLNTKNSSINVLNTALGQISSTDFIANVGKSIDSNFIEGAQGIGFISQEMLANGFSGSSFADSFMGGAESVAMGAMAKATRAMGQGVGTMVGSSLGSAVGGIYGPIGSAVGGLIGSSVGSMFNPPPPVHFAGVSPAYIAAQKNQQETLEQLKKQRAKIFDQCEESEKKYWKHLDAFFYNFGLSWMKKERELGFKFQLRWFDDTTGPAYYLEPDQLARFGARVAVNPDHNAPVRPGLNKDEAYYHSYISSQGAAKRIVTACTFPMAGCPYPDMKQAKLPYPGTKNFGARRQYQLPSGLREARVFAARDLIWLPSDERLSCDAYIPDPHSQQYAGPEAARQRYMRMLAAKVDEIDAKQAALLSASTVLISDLARTFSAYQAYLETITKKQVYRSSGVNLNDIRAEEKVLSFKHESLNNIALYGGLGALAYSLFRAVKR